MRKNISLFVNVNFIILLVENWTVLKLKILQFWFQNITKFIYKKINKFMNIPKRIKDPIKI